MVVHGIPGPYALERGDVISLDVGVTLDGWVADAARTLSVGPAGALAATLLEGTERALFAGVVPVPIYPQLTFKNLDGYLDTVAGRLRKAHRVGSHDVDELSRLRDRWRDQPRMWQDQQVWLHGDATPAN